MRTAKRQIISGGRAGFEPGTLPSVQPFKPSLMHVFVFVNAGTSFRVHLLPLIKIPTLLNNAPLGQKLNGKLQLEIM